MTDTDPTAGNPSPSEVETDPTTVTEDQPATDAAKSETDAGQEGEGAQEGAPEAYEAFTVPEGFKLEGDRLSVASEFFKGNNFTQAQAQAAVDLFTKLAGEDVGALTQALEAQRAEKIESWGQQARETLGAKYDETINLARTAVKHVNDPELTEAFESEGWGNHPAMIRTFAKLGELLRDSKVEGLGGETATGTAQSEGERAYQYAEKPQRRNSAS